jgi:hypothetical protein
LKCKETFEPIVVATGIDRIIQFHIFLDYHDTSIWIMARSGVPHEDCIPACSITEQKLVRVGVHVVTAPLSVDLQEQI